MKEDGLRAKREKELKERSRDKEASFCSSTLFGSFSLLAPSLFLQLKISNNHIVVRIIFDQPVELKDGKIF